MSQNNLELKLTPKKTMFLLGVIIASGIYFRLMFSHFELPLNSDNLQYFLYAVDHSLGESVNSFKLHNTGWGLFLSFFFSVFNSNNYMDFMALQKVISIIIESLTAIPIYFLGKKFFSDKLALLGSILFVFEPRIVQNSTFGISDPLYIIGLTIAIVFLVNSRKNFEFLAFTILGLSIIVRSEGLFLIPAFIIVYFWQKSISKKSILRILICLLIISTILSMITYQKSFENENDGLFSRIDSGVTEIYSSPETNSAGGPINLLLNGAINFIKFLGWSQFPVWMFFVPAGFIILLISKNQKTGIIFTLLFFISLPTLYAFSFSNETRYLFPLYPIFSILALFFLNKINQCNKKFSILQIVIIVGLITSSSGFLIWKDIDIENEFVAFDLMKNISDDKKIVNYFGYESSYRITTVLEKVQGFPITSSEIEQHSMKIINISRVSSLEEFMKDAFEKKLTHLV
ncbi:MAG: glycosyltransferase family 39 protein, partial [Nitrosopumilus sp.]|nr:glycosyltransferase family 39 protein [Nitrosopumilus sp.]